MGGGSMRAAAKVFSEGVVRYSVPLGPAVATAHKCTATPISAMASTGDILSSANTRIDAVQKPLWEFSGNEDAELFYSAYPPRRVVFGGVPTMEEASAAASDLKEALEKVCISSPNVTVAEGSSSVVPGSCRYNVPGFVSPHLLLLVLGDHRSVTKPVHNVISLLKERPEVQNLFASLATDKTVWEAVMTNSKLLEFIQSQKAVSHLKGEIVEETEESFAANGHFTSSRHGSGEQTLETSTSWFTWFKDNIKRTKDNIKMRVDKIASIISELFQSVTRISAEKISSAYSKRFSADFVDKDIDLAVVIKFVILVIMVVLLKRI